MKPLAAAAQRPFGELNPLPLRAFPASGRVVMRGEIQPAVRPRKAKIQHHLPLVLPDGRCFRRWRKWLGWLRDLWLGGARRKEPDDAQGVPERFTVVSPRGAGSGPKSLGGEADRSQALRQSFGRSWHVLQDVVGPNVAGGASALFVDLQNQVALLKHGSRAARGAASPPRRIRIPSTIASVQSSSGSDRKLRGLRQRSSPLFPATFRGVLRAAGDFEVRQRSGVTRQRRN